MSLSRNGLLCIGKNSWFCVSESTHDWPDYLYVCGIHIEWLNPIKEILIDRFILNYMPSLSNSKIHCHEAKGAAGLSARKIAK